MDISISVLVAWFVIDAIFMGVDIWLRLRTHGWDVTKVHKDDIDKIMKLLDDNYQYIMDVGDYKIFRREHD
jgi:hypothetical protein